MNPLAEALTAEQARECVDAYLSAVERLDATLDTEAFVSDMRRAVRVTEINAETVPQVQYKPSNWPSDARVRAMELRASGLGTYQTAQILAEEYDRPCRHSLIAAWERRA